MPPSRRRAPSRRKRKASTTHSHPLTKTTALGLIVLIVYISFRFTLPANGLGEANPNLQIFERLWLRARLGRNIHALTADGGHNVATQDFIVHPGDSATNVSLRLAKLNVIPNASLLRDYLLYTGMDSQIEAGFFQFRPGMTTFEVASALTSSLPSEIKFHMWSGWRIEEVADALSRHPHLSVDRHAFLGIANRQAALPGNYKFLHHIPATATLEGFLYPGDYIFPPRADSTRVINQMLTTFDAQTARIQKLAKNQNLTLLEFVTLASIVERETILNSEGPLIAGVFFNRLALQMPLGADPTVQYGLATKTDWWPALTMDPRLLQHTHNTYLHTGLPPSPIASPSTTTLESVGSPAYTDFLYFRAACDESGRHNFSRTYREHLLWDCGI